MKRSALVAVAIFDNEGRGSTQPALASSGTVHYLCTGLEEPSTIRTHNGAHRVAVGSQGETGDVGTTKLTPAARRCFAAQCSPSYSSFSL